MSIGLGEIVYFALKPVLKIYLILTVGYLLAKYNVVGVEAARSISNMVVNAILPCLVFNKIVANIQAKDIKEIAVIVLSACILFCLGALASIIIKYTLPVPKKWVWGLRFAGLFPNISDLPIAYVQSMGTGIIFNSDSVDKGVAYCCIFLTTQSFLMMNFGMFRLVGLDFREKLDDIESSSSTSSAEQTHPKEEENSSPFSNSIGNTETKNDVSSVSSSDSKDSSIAAPKPAMTIDHPVANTVATNTALNTGVTHVENDVDDEDENALESLSESDLGSTDQLEIHRPQLFRKGTSASSDVRNRSPNDPKPLTRAKTASSNGTYDGTNAALNRTTSLSLTPTNLTSITSHSSQYNRSRRRRRSQTINDVISEYSVVERVRTGDLDLTRPLTLTADIGEENAALGDDDNSSVSSHPSANTAGSNERNSLSLARTATNKSLRKVDSWFHRHKLGWLEYIAINCFRPASLGAMLGIICSMIPWVQALFVKTYVHVHNAPDQLPVLNFLMDATAYIGNACVPLGLLLLGGTIARLQVNELPKGFLSVAFTMAGIRLAVIPIIGVLWANKIYSMKWIESDIAKLVVIITFAMPSATAQVYFTAFFTPVDGPHLQMDCLSVLFLVQYIFLWITLPFVVSYALKVDIKV